MKAAPKIVSRAEWTKARKEHLAKEKEFSRLRDELSAARRELPWVKVDKDYVFDSAEGKVKLADLFGGKSQLIIYHFMLGPNDKAGCPSCSYLADNFEPSVVHLAARDTALVAVSRAGLKSIDAFKKRMGWTFQWVSSEGSDFNFDYQVSYTPEQMASGKVEYNYEQRPPYGSEGPGASVFVKGADGSIYHTYSTYARGLDMLIATYHYLDLTPKGRDEKDLPWGMAWLRHHDSY